MRDEELWDKGTAQVDLAELQVAEGLLQDAERSLREIEPAMGRSFEWNLCMAEIERNRGQYQLAERRAAVQEAAARKTDDEYALNLALRQSLRIHIDQGDLRRADEEVNELERSRSFLPVAPYFRAQLALRQNRWEEAERQSAEALSRLREVDLPFQMQVSLVRAEALTGAGRPAEALRMLDEMAPVLDRSRRLPLQVQAKLCRLRAESLTGSCPGSARLQDAIDQAHRLGMQPVSKEADRVAAQLRTQCSAGLYAARH